MFAGKERDMKKKPSLPLVIRAVFIAATALAADQHGEKRCVASLDRDGVQRIALTGGE